MTYSQGTARRFPYALVKLVVLTLVLGAGIGGGIFLALALMGNSVWGDGLIPFPGDPIPGDP
ncbi:hypothetical protein FLW53_04320 [Microbispora sp. SCL1-1]|uniref:Uncharacterized protein n=1 Tax=Microbispora hainanensis TaxID=568844 RepID=A0ABZ1T1Y0_9ACTN|nr:MULTISPECIES: hypothetical protein [Microbispora]NJP23441.1 hypothetical protein [Microbispora sp. CL1-1]TQS16492.1 hypothetical protein FLW53_04320 [Microbispora sp. SCL1-1]